MFKTFILTILLILTTPVFGAAPPVIEDILPDAPVINEAPVTPNVDVPVIDDFSEINHTVPAIPEYRFDFDPENLEPSTITAIIPPDDVFRFVIEASSSMGIIEHQILEDNRIVIDIFNASTDLRGELPGAEPLVKAVRVAEHETFTRVVLDMAFAHDHLLQFNVDRTRLYIIFIPGQIHEISFAAESGRDYITIIGENIWVNLVQYLQYSLTINLPLAYMEDLPAFYPGLEYDFGYFITDLGAEQISETGIRIFAPLSGDISYDVTHTGNVITIIIDPPTYQNITFDRISSTINLLNSEEVILTRDMLNISHSRHFENLNHTLTFNADLSEHFGFGRILFFSPFTGIIEVSTEGTSQIVLNDRSIAYIEIFETEEGLTIRTFSPREVYNYIVMLDPGHGGHDPGATHFGFRESDLVLIISNLVYDKLKDTPNVGVFTTRYGDYFVSLTGRANLANPVADLFVSVHMNAFTNPTPRGTETYYLAREGEEAHGITGREVAEIFQRNLLEDLNLFDRGVRTANFAVLRLTDMPSVLLEIGFLSNPGDSQVLSNPNKHPVIAESIYRSILETKRSVIN